MTRDQLFSRRSVIKSLAASGLAFGATGVASAARSAGDDGGVYVVTASGRGAGDELRRAGYEVRHELADGDVYIVAGSNDGLESVDGVAHAVPNVPADVEGPEYSASPGASADEPLIDRQWDKQVTRAVEAHDAATGDGRTVAIIDSGVDHDHPDLAPNVDGERGRQFKQGNARSGTDSIVVPVDMQDPRKGTKTVERPVADDVYGHGSHVAGIAAAPANGTGIVGTAPDASIVPLRIGYWQEIEFGDQTFAAHRITIADVLLAIEYAAEIGADAANLSLGWGPLPPRARSSGLHVAFKKVVKDAVRRGTVVVASAGNAMTDLQHGGTFGVPNSLPGTVSVSATGPNDERSFYSNYGTSEIDVAAPGGGYETFEKTFEAGPDEVEWPHPTNFVLSSVPEEIFDEQYQYFPGTSMAAPQVTGLAGLVRELDPSANANQVEQAIAHGAVGANGRSSPDLGAGRVDALNTVERASKKR